MPSSPAHLLHSFMKAYYSQSLATTFIPLTTDSHRASTPLAPKVLPHALPTITPTTSSLLIGSLF